MYIMYLAYRDDHKTIIFKGGYDPVIFKDFKTFTHTIARKYASPIMGLQGNIRLFFTKDDEIIDIYTIIPISGSNGMKVDVQQASNPEVWILPSELKNMEMGEHYG